MTRLRFFCALIIVSGILSGCAEEDDSIVNPVSGGRRITMRLYNLIPDGQARRLVMEEGFASTDVPMFSIGDTVQSPGDSTFLEITRGDQREYRSPRRVPFVPNTSYNVYAVAGRENQRRFDTIVLTNANTPGSALGYAQVRLVNMHADPNRSYELRLGCPSGPPVISQPTVHRQISQFREVFPGSAVFSLIEYREGRVLNLGTFETQLRERGAYSLVLHESEAGDAPQLMFVEETDLSNTARRPFTVVSSRTADLRVVNLTAGAIDVDMPRLSINLAKGLASRQIGARVAVSTCEEQRPDRVEVRLSSGATLVDSASLVVRNLFTVIVADSGAGGKMVIAPMIQRPLGVGGKAVVRVIHASAGTPRVRVSTSSRSSATNGSGIQPAVTLARDLGSKDISAPVAIDAGSVPLTITSESTPTTLLRATTLNVQADRSYDLILHDRLGALEVTLIEQEVAQRPVELLTEAALVTFVHGATGRGAIPVSLGSAISDGRLYYGNTVSTCLEQSDNAFSIDGITGQLTVRNADRTLVVYSAASGTPQVLQFRTLPLLPKVGTTIRRVVNATKDVPLLSVSVDSIATSEAADMLARSVASGAMSEPMQSSQDRRGTYFFFNAETREQVYTLPVRLATLGNNFTLIVLGSKADGYDVIVLQEF